MKDTQVQISKRALIQRIDRRLPEGEIIRTMRGERFRAQYGDYFVVNTLTSNVIVRTHVDLEDLGRELGALKAWERLADDD